MRTRKPNVQAKRLVRPYKKMLAALLLAAVALATAGCGHSRPRMPSTSRPPQPGDWPFLAHDAARTSWNRTDTRITAANVGRLRLAWTAPLSQQHELVNTLLGSADEDNTFDSSPVVANGIVYAGSRDHHLYAFDTRTGSKLWAAKTDDKIDGTPAVAGGRVFVGSENYPHAHLYAFDAVSGSKLWSTRAGYEIGSSPLVANGIVYVGSTDGNLYAFDANTGKKLWVFACHCDAMGTPSFADGVIYAGSEAAIGQERRGTLAAVDAKTGKRLWRRKLGGDIWPEAPAIVGRFAYIRTWGTLASVSRADGTPRWELDTLSSWQEHDSAAVARGIIYIGSYQFGLRAFATRSGHLLWQVHRGAARSITVTPAITSGLVFAGSWDHRLYAFDARTGKTVWSAMTGWAISSSPAIAHGSVYVGSDDKLYCFRLPGGWASDAKGAKG